MLELVQAEEQYGDRNWRYAWELASQGYAGVRLPDGDAHPLRRHATEGRQAMIYFMGMSVLCAVLGLAAIAAATDVGMSLFGYGLFGFGVAFALFLLKRHFDHQDGTARP